LFLFPFYLFLLSLRKYLQMLIQAVGMDFLPQI